MHGCHVPGRNIISMRKPREKEDNTSNRENDDLLSLDRTSNMLQEDEELSDQNLLDKLREQYDIFRRDMAEKLEQGTQTSFKKHRRKKSMKNNNFIYAKSQGKKSSPRGSHPSFIKSKFAPLAIQTKRQILGENQCDPSKEYYRVREEEMFEDPTSAIYVTSRFGINYKLMFKTKNAILEPLFLRPRSPPPKENEKISQIRSRMRVVEEPRMLNYVVVKRPKYSLIKNSFAEKPAPKIRVFTPNPIRQKKRKNDISKPKRSSTTGFIYIAVDGFMFKVRVDPLSITKIRNPITDHVRKTMEHLKMPLSEEFKNKGQLLVRFGNDLLRLHFDLTNCNVSRIPEYRSLGVQTENDFVIRQLFSHFSGKKINLKLPESTYFYTDPMADIFRLNHYFRTVNVTPLWKYEMFQKRMAQLREHDSLEGDIGKALKRARGSHIVFEGFDAIVTAIGGLMCCTIVKGKDTYEERIRALGGEKKIVENEEAIGEWKQDSETNVPVNEFESHLWETEEVSKNLESLNGPPSGTS
ncbi:hypothetical protein Aperf_G00000025553 [Anoplocephala perfoliata]